MEIVVREYTEDDLAQMITVWNDIVEEGMAFPEEVPLTKETGHTFFTEQSYTGVAEEDGVKSGQRGKNIGEKMVLDSLKVAVTLGFRIMQFNAVVVTNKGAIHLYEKLGFTALGIVPNGFRQKDGSYVDIMPFYIELES